MEPKKKVSVLFLVGVDARRRPISTLSLTERFHGSDMFAATKPVLVAFLFLVLFLFSPCLGGIHLEVLTTGSSVGSEEVYLVHGVVGVQLFLSLNESARNTLEKETLVLCLCLESP